jgi:hypothetical protein
MAHYVDETGETIIIEMTQDMKNACDASYLEMLNYYTVYPMQFFRDAYRYFVINKLKK